MEFEQVIKRLDWLDEEHRKEKSSLNQISEHLTRIDANHKLLEKKIKDLTKEISSFNSLAMKIDQLEESIKSLRNELVKKGDDAEKSLEKGQKETDKRYRLELDGLNRSIDTLQKTSDLSELNRKMEARITEEQRFNKVLTGLDGRINQNSSSLDALQQADTLIMDNMRQETKKTSDLLVETTSLKKKVDELKAKTDIFPDSMRRIETRVDELSASESERRQIQKNFIDQQALLQIERDQVQKELKDRIEKMGRQSQLLETQLQEWDSVQRAVQHAQQVYEDLTQKFERRINEITEMQRLSEDRFRQEWVTFKADYQKRWASYTLSQEEQLKETLAEINKIQERVAPIEDISQTQQDILVQTKEANEEYLHGLQAQIQELISAYERIMGRSR